MIAAGKYYSFDLTSSFALFPFLFPVMKAFTLLLLTAAPALAQTSFHIGPRVGASLTTVYYSGSGAYGKTAADFPTTYRPGFEAGVVGSWQWGHLAVQPALLFQRNGYYSDYSYSSSFSPSTAVSVTTSLNYLTLPIDFVYTQRVNGQGLQLLAGPYFSALVGGRFQSIFIDYPSNDRLEIDGQVVAGDHNPSTPGRDDIYYKRLDAGLQVGLGYQYQKWLLQASYSWGLRNLAATYLGPGNASNPNGITLTALPTRTRAMQLSLAYLLHR
jgi:hypothetical protein